jgi:hypothetical protein
VSEPTKHGLGPADDRDVEQADHYRRRRAVDEAMAVYSTDDVLSRDPGDNRGAAEDYGADFDPDAIPRAEPEPEPPEAEPGEGR